MRKLSPAHVVTAVVVALAAGTASATAAAPATTTNPATVTDPPAGSTAASGNGDAGLNTSNSNAGAPSGSNNGLNANSLGTTNAGTNALGSTGSGTSAAGNTNATIGTRTKAGNTPGTLPGNTGFGVVLPTDANGNVAGTPPEGSMNGVAAQLPLNSATMGGTTITATPLLDQVTRDATAREASRRKQKQEPRIIGIAPRTDADKTGQIPDDRVIRY